MRAGSLQNMLYDEAVGDRLPAVGDGATVIYWTDRQAATVIAVSRTGHRITVQDDHAIRTDTNGMSDAQAYRYEPNPAGQTREVTRRRDSSYRVVGSTQRVLIGTRRHYHDFSF